MVERKRKAPDKYAAYILLLIDSTTLEKTT